ncbi:DUF2934 domain-containing protein [Rhizobium binxianense]
MTEIDKQWVEKRAYELWEAEGWPVGKDLDHWQRATEEFLAISGAAQQTMSRTRENVKVTGKKRLSSSSTRNKRPEASKEIK